MKKYYWILVLIIAALACKEEEIFYTIYITGCSHDTVSVGDTVEVYIDWKNSQRSDQLTTTVNDVNAKSLGFKDDTTILVIIPKLTERQASIILYHPNGAYDNYIVWEVVPNPRITQQPPLKGTAGDELTIRGVDFSKYDSVVVVINTLPCQITAFNDSTIKFVIPLAPGNGMVTVRFHAISGFCNLKKTIELGLFKYHFKELSGKSVVKAYTDGGYSCLLERDEVGRVSKRVITRAYSKELKNSYEIISYGDDGLVDSIKRYDDDVLQKFWVYQRDANNTFLRISSFDAPDDDGEIYECHYVDGKLIQLDDYLPTREGLYHTFTNTYIYDGEFLIKIIRHDFNMDGSDKGGWEAEFEMDRYNGQLPDIGIPGYYDGFFKYPEISTGWSNSILEYDEYGRLKRWTEYNNDCFSDLYKQMTFEYE